MNRIIVLLALLTVLLLTGCKTTTQLPIQIDNTLWLNKETKIGVIMSDIPKPETHIYGAGCLLCYAAAATANASLDKHLKNIPSNDIADLKKTLVNMLKSRGLIVTSLDKNINVKKL